MLEEVQLRGGSTLVLQRRDATLRKSEPRQRPKRRPPKAEQMPTSRLQVPGSRVSGILCGSYTFADEAFKRAGMLVLIVEPTAAGDAVLESLPPLLRFMSFAFRLPDTTADGRTPTLSSWRDDIYEVLHALRGQHPQLLIRALVGHGAAADAAHDYAATYGHAASCPSRLLVQLAGSHNSSKGWPSGGWRMLSLVGSADGSSLAAAELFHLRHRPAAEPSASKLRLLDGAERTFDGHMPIVAASINDWLEGARRLTGDDVARWSATGGPGASRAHPVDPLHAATAAKPARDSPTVASMARARELQLEALADDLPISEHMLEWTEERLQAYFDSGGESEPGHH